LEQWRAVRFAVSGAERTSKQALIAESCAEAEIDCRDHEMSPRIAAMVEAEKTAELTAEQGHTGTVH